MLNRTRKRTGETGLKLETPGIESFRKEVIASDKALAAIGS
jgi:hypothetical protein